MNAATAAMIAIKTLQKDSKKYLYKDFFKISKLELHLISLGSEFQNLVADTWKVLAPSDSLLYFGQIKLKDPYLLCLSVDEMWNRW